KAIQYGELSFVSSYDKISFKKDGILYILENATKNSGKLIKDQKNENTRESQIGLEPCNYIKKAESKSVLKAVYDYEAQSEEELSIYFIYMTMMT
ncbi:41535_t:CDS:2, partial [Gigaspora margarita]